MDLYETYLRMADGNTYHPSTIRAGIEDFLGPNGYRISFIIDGVVLTLRRGIVVDRDMVLLDEVINQDSVDCAVTIRGHK